LVGLDQRARGAAIARGGGRERALIDLTGVVGRSGSACHAEHLWAYCSTKPRVCSMQTSRHGYVAQPSRKRAKRQQQAVLHGPTFAVLTGDELTGAPRGGSPDRGSPAEVKSEQVHFSTLRSHPK